MNSNKTNLLLNITIILTTVYLMWRIIFTLPFHFGILSLAMGILLVASEAASALETFEQYRCKRKSREIIPPVIPEAWFPDVDVLIATHNEPVDLLYATANACTFLDYPDKSKVHVYLCDDTNRPEVSGLAKQLGVGYFGMTENTQAKAGNLNNALAQTTSPLIATFDADMIPMRQFLMKMVPYFFLPQMKQDENGEWVPRKVEEIDPDYKLGFVQAPQSFYNPDLFQFNLYSEKNVPNEQDFFFKEVNVLRNSNNAAIYAGSNTVISRKALEEVGGIAVNTITEDFETGMKIQGKGYTTYAISEVLANGMAPNSIKSLIKQRQRWARGCIQSLRHIRLLTNKDIKWGARLSYLTCYSYWWSFFRRMIFIFAPILFSVFDIQVAVCSFWELACIWLPSHILYSISLRKMSGNIRNQHWCNVIDTIIFPYMVIPVILESLGIKQHKFVVTKKDRGERRSKSTIWYALPQFMLLVFSAIGLVRLVANKYGWELIAISIVIYWLIFNAINLAYAIFFMWGRDAYRKTERFTVSLPASIEARGRVFHAQTADISEQGVSVLLDRPEYFSTRDTLSITVESENYLAHVKGVVKYVKLAGSKWKYCIQLTEMGETDKRQYLQLVYDRLPSLPTQVDIWRNTFDDINLNINSRLERRRLDLRTLPRVELNAPAQMEDGTVVWLQDFNYRYALLSGTSEKGMQTGGCIRIFPDDRVSLQLKAVKSFTYSSEGMQLYEVLNHEDLVDDAYFTHLLDQWMAANAKDADKGEQFEECLSLKAGVHR